MKEMIEARIAQLEAELAAEKAKLEKLLAEIPEQYHSLTAELFAKIKAFFEGA